MKKSGRFLVVSFIIAICAWFFAGISNRTGRLHNMDEIRKLNGLYGFPSFATEGELLFSEHRSSLPYHVLVVFGEMKGTISDWIYNKEIKQCTITGNFSETDKREESSLKFSDLSNVEVYFPDCIAKIGNEINKYYKLQQGIGYRGNHYYYILLEKSNMVLCEFHIKSSTNILLYSHEHHKFILYIHVH